MQNDTLPPAIETQIQNLEARHARHQAMEERHREEKHQRRERHRQGWHRGGHKVSHIPVVLR